MAGPGPRATLPPALLHRAATETPPPPPPLPPPLRCNKPTADISVHGRNKRKLLLPPSGKSARKPKAARHAPWASCSSSSSSSMVTTATAERKRALDKKVAGCLLTRSWAGAAVAWPREGQTALPCPCLMLPRGSSCALHQAATGRSWMEEQKGGVLPLGDDGEREMPVPMVRAGDGAEGFAEYDRWRKNVRMPSRFYTEHVRAINAGQDD